MSEMTEDKIPEMIAIAGLKAMDDAPEIFKTVLHSDKNILVAFIGTMARLEAMKIALFQTAMASSDKMGPTTLANLEEAITLSVVSAHVLGGALEKRTAESLYSKKGIDVVLKKAADNVDQNSGTKDFGRALERLNELLRKMGKT